MKIEFKYLKKYTEEDANSMFLMLLTITVFTYGVWIGLIYNSLWLLGSLTIGAFFVIAFLVEPLAKIKIRRVK